MSGWISVKDRLPEYEGEYLVKRGGKIMIAARQPFFFHDAIWNAGGYIQEHGLSIIPDDEVTHWAELPKEGEIEFKPVTQAKWKRELWFITCPNCGCTMADKDDEGEWLPTNFCPNCGADMREGEDE